MSLGFGGMLRGGRLVTLRHVLGGGAVGFCGHFVMLGRLGVIGRGVSGRLHGFLQFWL
jgi:hypothetical protein